MAGREFQTAAAMKLNEQLPKDVRLYLGIFKSFSLKDWRVQMIYTLNKVCKINKIN